MTSLKNIELSIRRGLLRLLGVTVTRGRPIPPSTDFNACKYLFVRQDRIGDVLVSTPLIYSLKNRYPGAVIDFFLSKNNHFALQNEPLVRKRWVYTKRLTDSIRLLRNIRREHYDFVIDLMDNPSATSTVICSLAGGKWNVGLLKENEFVYDVTVPLLSRKETHIVDRLAQLLKVFNIDVNQSQLAIRYLVSPESERISTEFFASKLESGKRVVGINISAGSEVRFWGVSNFRELIGRLVQEHPDIRILLLFAPQEQPRAVEIAESFPRVVLSPMTHSFDEFAALIQHVDLLVTPDTSAVHLAAAFNIPSVVLYVQSNKELRVWEPYRSESAIHVTDVDDVTTIPPNEVYESVRKLIDRTSSSSVSSSPSAALQSR